MSLRTSATRYARALLAVAIQEDMAVKVEHDLAALAGVIGGHAELSSVLTNPGVPHAARVGIVRAIAERLAVEVPLSKLLVILAARGRLELVPDLLEVYRERLREHQNVVHAVVTAAVPLTPDAVQALAHSLAGVTGKHVEVDAAVDPSLIGGVVARIGSTVYDGSLRTRLAQMKQRLRQDA